MGCLTPRETVAEGGWGRWELHNWWRSKKTHWSWALLFLLEAEVLVQMLMLPVESTFSHCSTRWGLQPFHIKLICHLLWEAFLAFNYNTSSQAFMLPFLLYFVNFIPTRASFPKIFHNVRSYFYVYYYIFSVTIPQHNTVAYHKINRINVSREWIFTNYWNYF